jgi:hypothetical protein
MKNSAGIAVLLAVCMAPTFARPVQRNAAPPREELSRRITRADPRKYRAIRDAKDWKNPILIIRRDGIEVEAKGMPSGSQTVALADLARTLVGLPVAAWPYGRVVVVIEIGIREPNGTDDQRITQNHEAAEKILKYLGVQISWWPSA